MRDRPQTENKTCSSSSARTTVTKSINKNNSKNKFLAIIQHGMAHFKPKAKKRKHSTRCGWVVKFAISGPVDRSPDLIYRFIVCCAVHYFRAFDKSRITKRIPLSEIKTGWLQVVICLVNYEQLFKLVAFDSIWENKLCGSMYSAALFVCLLLLTIWMDNLVVHASPKKKMCSEKDCAKKWGRTRCVFILW